MCTAGLQVLLNCAGIRQFASIEDVTPEQMVHSYKINAMGPVFTVQQLLKRGLLQQGSLIANVTSLVRCVAIGTVAGFSEAPTVVARRAAIQADAAARDVCRYAMPVPCAALYHKGVLTNATPFLQVASITENGGGSNYPYRCSKIAANMATKSMSIDLEPRGITSTIQLRPHRDDWWSRQAGC